MLGNLFKRITTGDASEWRMTTSDAVIAIHPTGEGVELRSPLLQGYIAQLIDDGLASEVGDGIELTWDDFYAAMESPGYTNLPELLGLPDFTQSTPSLRSSGSLTDEHFSIVI